ncbi:vacuolar protein sorting-associated protein 33A [Condylostylus longicornis]|uniref:vacuolar protein sorting-associated protein 33A n=1 Tax=Condylostylus longicornis TaxID=2530218 RepID=UPI00244E1C3B|nr:vacuolar protein sorting-associated protein 33A [Condylostylus longicornis]XP_055389016.1 vacuolar protein sorting-associated protein 33A [Condylostylus longicornis]XP_055389024.1 vacuolar protein sorting-associated protein 33A [Condylostylus longicornis]XP_055389026.1 vacuolar protein sorting-associated protein 33A [Condylostylus longicornis]
MPIFSHLTGYRVNLALLQENANKDFIELLERAEGSKAIVLDLENNIDCLMSLMIESALLKQQQVIKQIPIRSGPLPYLDVKNIIFITRPEVKMMDYIAENLLSENSDDRKYRGSRKDYYLYFLPRRSEFCEKRLINKDVYGTFTHVGELSWEFFPLDKDLISMEQKYAFRDLLIDEDPTCLYEAALGLVNLQKVYGRIPKIYGKGNYAEKVWEYAKTLGREEKSMFNSDKGSIDQMIIFDRTIDIMSVLATQLTYEGLIDENYDIKQGVIRLPMEKFSKSNEGRFQAVNQDEKIVVLNSAEELFSDLRDKNFNAIGLILSEQAKLISKQLEQKQNDKSIQEMKEFVEKLPYMMAKKQSVAIHTTLGEMIKDIADSSDFLDDLTVEQEFMSCINTDKTSSYIEDLIAKKADIRRVIRLICMQCVASSGFKPKIFDYYKRELVQVYGINTLLTLSNLQKAGLFKLQGETRPYAVLKKTLNLTVEEVKEVEPMDISYVHSFYAPLTIRIVEQILKSNGWHSVKNVLNILPCASFEDFQAPLIGIGGRRASYTSEKSLSDSPRIILVFFVGGCTFAEIAALRFLSKDKEANVEFVIATTKIINKNTFLDSFIEKI